MIKYKSNTKLVIKMGVVWIGPNVLGKTYDQNINVPNNYARTVEMYIHKNYYFMRFQTVK